ncbi:NAD(P)-binding domain-containing protein [Phenylobacterium sp.]|uniref:NAD(P)-dependent oxidoreductase n=1 Tax=Phenylobacterium sp. TaxID=1871053 RepID=UPI002812077A|nr:NAD(P)-binding domain-containing protein [Phenylobacterium sp.]
MSDVTILGLGQMGLTLADLLLKAGRTVTVWNRTPGKSDALSARGGRVATSPAEAAAASPIVLLIVYDDAAAEAVLTAQDVHTALADRLVVNLGTTGPDAARRFGELVTRAGGRYLDGAIQAAPSQMGQPDTPIFVAGPLTAYAQAEPVLKVLGGNLVHLGERIDAAAFTDLATLSYVYGAYAGFLHGARIAESVGVDVAAYGKLVRDISPSFGAFFAHQGGVIQSGDFTVSESPLRISISAIDRILKTSRDLALNDQVPAILDGWLKAAEGEGLADAELAALIKVLRR